MTTFSGGGFYEKLGVRPFINLEGSLTLSGGFTPSPAVSAAMEEANARFCDMEHLLDGAGRFIADALGVEAAYVAPGGICRADPQRRRADGRRRPGADEAAARHGGHGQRVRRAGVEQGGGARLRDRRRQGRLRGRRHRLHRGPARGRHRAQDSGDMPVLRAGRRRPPDRGDAGRRTGPRHPARRRRRRDEPPARPVPRGRPQRRPGQLRRQVLRRAQRHRVRVRKQAPGRFGREAGGLTPPRRLRGVRTRLQARQDAGRRHRRRARRVDEHGPRQAAWRTRPAC